MKTDIHVLAEDDIGALIELLSVFASEFEMENFVLPDKAHLLQLLKKENFVAIAAKAEGRTIGGMTVYVLDRYYSEKPLAYVYDFAVSAEHQRKGIGKKLMRFATGYFRQKGFEELYVQADATDDHAIAFYRSTNPSTETRAIHFGYAFNINPEDK